MKRRLILLLILLATIPAIGQNVEEPPQLEVVTSKTHSLYYLLECLIDTPHRSPQIATNFRSRVGNWGPVEQALERWKEELNSPALSQLRFPPVQGRTPTLAGVLEKVALQSEGAADLAERASPWLGPEAGERFRLALELLEPLHERYWWRPKAMQDQREQLLQELRQGDFEQSFSQAAAFYQGELATGAATVALVPYIKGIGETRTATRGHNAGELQVFEVVLDQSQQGRAGVCFHEFAHGLWAGQQQSERTRWQERFFRHGLWGRLAYAQLNEGLATALGNGWFHHKVTGELENGSWYVDSVIDTYGKALYPVVQEAVEEGRPPSDEELDLMVATFRKHLPQADRTFDVVASRFLTVTSREEAHRSRYQSELMRLGPVRESGVQGWDGEPGEEKTFLLYWLQEGDEPKLDALGLTLEHENNDARWALRQTDHGWELAFLGEQEALFRLLRLLQSKGLGN